jgi:hypothetical protein
MSPRMSAVSMFTGSTRSALGLTWNLRQREGGRGGVEVQGARSDVHLGGGVRVGVESGVGHGL